MVLRSLLVTAFPLVQLPQKFKVKIGGAQIENRSFPLVQLPQKFKVPELLKEVKAVPEFPLVQLPQKFKADRTKFDI